MAKKRGAPPQRVLIADGDHARGRRIAAACGEIGLEALTVTHGAAALEAALARPPMVLIAQMGLPLIDGEQLGGILRTNPRTASVNLIFIADTSAEAARDVADGQVIAPPMSSEKLARLAQECIEQLAAHPPAPEDDVDDAAGVDGQISQISLADLLQLFHVSQKTGVVTLERRIGDAPTQIGRVVLQRGDLVHAEVDTVVGEKALYRLLGWDRGDFAFRPGVVGDEATLEKPTRTLLREGQRQVQERARMAVSLPALDAQVRLKIRRSSLPIVIHPLTQDVLLVLEAYTRVGDVVDHCSFPDYQVLRTLRTLIDRGMVEIRGDSGFGQPPSPSGLFSAAPGARLREWLGVDPDGDDPPEDAKLLVIAADPSAASEFGRLLQSLPGSTLDPEQDRGSPVGVGNVSVGNIGRLAIDAHVGIQFVQVPADRRYAPLWPMGARGAIGVLLLLTGSVASALDAVSEASRALSRLPRARIFHLLMLDKEGGIEPDALRENPSLFDESQLFLIPLGNPSSAQVLLREMFLRILP